MGTEIRLARVADVPQVVEMVETAHAESPAYRNTPLSVGKVRLLIEQLQPNEHGAILIVAARGERLIGMVAGYVAEHVFSKVKYATDLLVYVPPAHRGGPTALRLLQDFEQRAVALGAEQILLGTSSGIRDAECARFYSRMGYTASSTVMARAV